MIGKEELNELLTVLRENRVQFFKCDGLEVIFPAEGFPMTASPDTGLDPDILPPDEEVKRIPGVPAKYYDNRLFPNGLPKF